MAIRADHDSILFVIRPDLDTTALAPWDSLWNKPVEKKETLPIIPKETAKISFWSRRPIHPWQLRGTLLAGRGQCEHSKKNIKEVYAGAEVTLLRHVRGPISAGMSLGYYHSVGLDGLHYMPWVAVVRFDLPLPYPVWPNVEVYGGLLHGMGRGGKYWKPDYPNCGLYGGRAGLNYRLPFTIFRLRPTISAGVSWGKISDNQSRLYPHTAEEITGLYGSGSISF